MRGKVPDMILCMDSAVDRYMAASQENDIDEMLATLAPDAELISPIVGSMVFRGHEDLRVVLRAIYGSLTGLRWHATLSDGRARVTLGTARIGPLTIEDAMLLKVGDDGSIRRIKPHLRPWGAITLFALKLGPRIARSPKVVQRALQNGPRPN